MLEEFIGKEVVVDLRSPFVCLGTLQGMDERYLDLRSADFHDLRDSDTSRDHYVGRSRQGGIMVNRKRVLVERSEVVAIGRLQDVIAE